MRKYIVAQIVTKTGCTVMRPCMVGNVEVYAEFCEAASAADAQRIAEGLNNLPDEGEG